MDSFDRQMETMDPLIKFNWIMFNATVNVCQVILATIKPMNRFTIQINSNQRIHRLVP